MDLNVLILIFSLLIQLTTFFIAIRLARFTESRIIGMVFVLVIFLMFFRPAISLFRFFSHGSLSTDSFAEVVALSISVLVLFGLVLMFRHFKLSKESRRTAVFTETLYQSLFNQSPDGVLLLGMKGEVIEFNEAACSQLGYTREEFKTLRISDLDPVESQVQIKAKLEDILAAGKAQFEVKHQTKHGEVRDVLVIAQGLELNHKIFIHAIWRDITEQRKAEEQSVYIMKAINSASDAIGISDAQGRHFFQNQALSDMFGYSTADELQAAGGGTVVVKDPEVGRAMFETITQGNSWAGELEMVTKSGHVFQAFERADAVKDNEGKIIGLIGIITDITERKKAQEALLHFQMVVDSSTEAIGISTPSGRHYYQNEAFTRLFGLSVQEIDGESGPPATVYVDESEGRRIFSTIMSGGSFSGEVKMLDKNRNIRDMYLRAYSIKNSEEKVLGLVGMHTDITDRKRADEKLKKSEQQLKESQRVAHLGSWDQNLISKELEWSEETYRLFDQAYESFKPSPSEFVRMVHPDDLKIIHTSFKNALTSDETPYHVIVRIINDSGREWVMEGFGEIRRDASGKALSIFGTTQDITEKRMAEEKIRQDEEFIRNILNTVGEGIIVLDRDFCILTANSAYCEQVGVSAEKVLGKHCYEVSHKTDQPCFTCGIDCSVQKVFETGQPHAALHHHNDAEGNPLYVETKAYPLKDNSGAVISVIETINNITEKHLLEEERLKTQKLESIGTLAGGIAHDFNNLLQGVFGFISLAKLSSNHKEKSVQMLEQAEEALHLAVNLTKQLLTFSKGGKPVKSLIRVEPLVENTVKFSLSGSYSSYELDAPPDLWMIEADEGQLAQVIQNMVLNASQAMPGGGMVRIKLSNVDLVEGLITSLPDGGRFVRIDIQDAGTGIESKNLTRIFDPYFTTKQKGSGLGLATSYSIINNHGGTIEVKSEVNRGSTFSVYMPASLEAETLIMSPSPDVLFSKKRRILFMDDETMIRNVGQAMITRLGHDIVCAEDGQKAITLFQEAKLSGFPFDLVILDLTVKGGMGGEEAIRKIREIDPDVKAVVSSGYSESPIVADYQAYGFSGVLSKPYRIESLKKCLDQFI